MQQFAITITIIPAAKSNLRSIIISHINYNLCTAITICMEACRPYRYPMQELFKNSQKVDTLGAENISENTMFHYNLSRQVKPAIFLLL